jgi:hypothetical protein
LINSNKLAENTSCQIAQTTLDQTKYTIVVCLMAWGAKDFVSLPESKEFQGGTMKSKCIQLSKAVKVINLTDLYEVSLSIIKLRVVPRCIL